MNSETNPISFKPSHTPHTTTTLSQTVTKGKQKTSYKMLNAGGMKYLIVFPKSLLVEMHIPCI